MHVFYTYIHHISYIYRIFELWQANEMWFQGFKQTSMAIYNVLCNGSVCDVHSIKQYLYLCIFFVHQKCILFSGCMAVLLNIHLYIHVMSVWRWLEMNLWGIKRKRSMSKALIKHTISLLNMIYIYTNMNIDYIYIIYMYILN